MNTHTVLVLFGALLLLAGIVGGGLSLKEITIPALNRCSRIIASIFGFLFIFSGIYMEKTPQEKPNPAGPVARIDPAAQPQPQPDPPPEPQARFQPKPQPAPQIQPQAQILGKYPEASLRYLNEADMAGKNRWDLRIMRNEVFARYGYIFETDVKEYFNKQWWYLPKSRNVDSQLTEIEKQNIDFIKRHE